MDWIKIVSALFLLAMLVMIFPGARRAMKEAPKGSMQDWMSYRTDGRSHFIYYLADRYGLTLLTQPDLFR